MANACIQWLESLRCAKQVNFANKNTVFAYFKLNILKKQNQKGAILA
jgi:hypothetical protein